ncbi:molybdate ABC transporter periplasmic molybdate-binding protein [Moraxella macacae 0408225]|uniref:Molybdate ABC transporter periplasmic molybdate-binding protein n=1 Tax=Moraxella macacae 0408225 TaxID=1230338 RepID=L2F7I4_9GAMM|nr:molybdate ABC transporter substrate-binding protein [Moraxella macacae]ELA09034.1 molybdate ABC transporter periplasmic molybdate-binding protein [Moraxella macacae 0408225]
MNLKFTKIALTALAFCAFTAHADVTVYAAASLTDAINDVNRLYEKKYRTDVKASYAASSTLAKQIQNGAKADVYLSADIAWMKHIEKNNLVKSNNVIHLLGNRLVTIAPKASPIKTINMNAQTLDNQFTGKLCTGNTDSVPVGKYAKTALTSLNWWDSVQSRIVGTSDVRSALNFVDRGECGLGIVYATDAKIAKNVKVVGTFGLATHTPIVYPAGLINDNNDDAKRYYQFLQSDDAKKIFVKYGFSYLK